MNIHCFLSVCLLFGPLVAGSVNSSCGGFLEATSAGKTFTSPGHPNNDFPAKTCIWTITTDPDQTIQLSTVESVLQSYNTLRACDSDSVTVYNGLYGSDVLGTFCGHQQPVFSSSGNTMRVNLQTDGASNHKGFKMLYKAVPAMTCNATLRAGPSPIQLVSPGFPDIYQSGFECQWTINAPYRTNINVEVLYIDMEATSSCLNDYLLFKDGPEAFATQLAKICEVTSTPIISFDNRMTIIFHSDGVVTGRGFRLQYSNDFTCGTSDLRASPNTDKYLTSPGYPTFNYYNLQCTWTISASPGDKIKINIVSLDVQNSTYCEADYLLVSDGSSSNAAVLGKYCGITGNHVIISGYHMTITFHTDGSARRRGFSLKYTSGRFLATTTTTVTPYVPSCGTSSLSATSTWNQLSSPSIPSSYANQVNCSWTISALVGNDVSVEIEELSIGESTSCTGNYLLVSDGPSSNAAELARYCGTTTGNVMSTNKDVTVIFHTDGTARHVEFTLRYKAISSGCGEHKVINYPKTTYVTSPNYPLYYPRNSNCAWTISTDIKGYVIYVITEEFNLVSDAMCSNYLKLFNVDGPNEYLMGQWCGYGGPNIRSTEMAVRVRFHSDDSPTYTGFKLAFTAGKPINKPFWLPNTGTLLGGILGGSVAVVVILICCCAICIKKKSTNNQSKKSNDDRVTSIFSCPGNTATTATAHPARSTPPPGYNESVEADHSLYSQTVIPVDVQPLVTSSPGDASAHGEDNPACTN